MKLLHLLVIIGLGATLNQAIGMPCEEPFLPERQPPSYPKAEARQRVMADYSRAKDLLEKAAAPGLSTQERHTKIGDAIHHLEMAENQLSWRRFDDPILNSRVDRLYLGALSQYLEAFGERGLALAQNPNRTDAENRLLAQFTHFLAPVIYHTGRSESDDILRMFDRVRAGAYPDLKHGIDTMFATLKLRYFIMTEAQLPPSAAYSLEKRAELCALPAKPTADEIGARLDAVEYAAANGDVEFSQRLQREVQRVFEQLLAVNSAMEFSLTLNGTPRTVSIKETVEFVEGQKDSFREFRTSKLSADQIEELRARLPR